MPYHIFLNVPVRARLQAWLAKYKIVFYDYSAMDILIENKNITQNCDKS